MLEEYQDLIEELLGTPGLVRTALAQTDGVPSDALLAQLAAVNQRDAAVLDRTQRIVKEPAAHFTVLPDFDTALAATTPPEDVEAFLQGFETTRGDLVSLLMNLTLKDWERTATHDRGASISLVDEIEEHVEFDEQFRAALAG